MPADWFALLRPAQWIKNAFVLAPLVFSHRFFQPVPLVSAVVAFAAFCLASSASYVMNDVLDRERDRGHPLKRLRPIAAGRIRPETAAMAAVLVTSVALALGWAVGERFLAVLVVFLFVQILYSTVLKYVVIGDVAGIALLFVLRAAGGVVAVEARMSLWLFLCTFLLAMFLGLGKRRHELVLLKHDAGDHREVLGRYSVDLLDWMIAAVAGATIVAYTIYSSWPSVEAKLGTERLYLTAPFVAFGVIRYLFLVYRREEGGSPTDLLLGDALLQVGIAGWIVTVFLLLYF
jgi:4-hydroxybenzoate polyprenyltransferase